MVEFPTMRVERSRSQSVEPLGSKPKFWFRDVKAARHAHAGHGKEPQADLMAHVFFTETGVPIPKRARKTAHPGPLPEGEGTASRSGRFPLS